MKFMDNRVNIGVVIGVIFVLAFAVTLTQSDKQVESQIIEDEIPEELIYEWLKKYDPSEQIISVSGSATASSNPDTLIIVLGVESEAKTANESLSQNSNSLNSVISSLKNSGISEDDIQTSNFSIYPLYDSIKDSDGKLIPYGERDKNTVLIEDIETDNSLDLTALNDVKRNLIKTDEYPKNTVYEETNYEIKEPPKPPPLPPRPSRKEMVNVDFDKISQEIRIILLKYGFNEENQEKVLLQLDKNMDNAKILLKKIKIRAVSLLEVVLLEVLRM